MKQFEVNCFEILETDSGDMFDRHLCYVSSAELAKAIIAKNSYRSYRKYSKLYTIFDTAEEIDANNIDNLRKSALAKLTTPEKEALGLL